MATLWSNEREDEHMTEMRWAPGRLSTVARDGMVATSQVPAVLAGLWALHNGAPPRMQRWPLLQSSAWPSQCQLG